MTDRKTRHFGAGLLLASTSVALPACADEQAKSAGRDKQWAAENLCHDKESVYLHAVRAGTDDAVSICVAEVPDKASAVIALRWRHGGKTSEWSCSAGECGKVFDYERYTRPQVTYLSLSFERGGLTYTIEDDYPGDDPDFDPKAPPTIGITAAARDSPDDFVIDEEYLLKTQRLGMMKLEDYIEMHPMP